MDGTLTPARRAMDISIAMALGKLSKIHYVGIVTGSGLDYVLEQCSILKEIFEINWDNIYLMPCNGTQVYKFESSKLRTLHSANMKDQIGKKEYNRIVSQLAYEQSVATATYEDLDSKQALERKSF